MCVSPPPCSVTSGWDGGAEDKCCSTDPSNCKWYSSMALCTQALTAAACRACSPGAGPDVGCPSWDGTDGLYPEVPYRPSGCPRRCWVSFGVTCGSWMSLVDAVGWLGGCVVEIVGLCVQERLCRRWGWAGVGT